MSGTPIHDEVVRDLTRKHLIRFNKRGWRCTCGEWLHTRMAPYSRQTAESHAFNVSGSIELAGSVSR
jgi:hypothetical protein